MSDLRRTTLHMQPTASLLALSTMVNVADICAAIIDHAARFYACDAAAVILVEKGGFRVGAARGWADADLDALIADPRAEDVLLLEIAAGRGVPMIVDDTQKSPLWAALPELRRVRSHAAVPLALDKGVFAVLCLESRAVGAFAETDRQGLETLGLHAAVAIQNARLYEQMARRTVEMDALRRLSSYRELNLELTEQITLILNDLLTLVEAASTDRLFLYEEGRLLWGIEQDIHNRPSRRIEEPEPDSLYYRVAREGECLVIDADGLIQPLALGEPPLRAAAVAVPLMVGQRVIGVVSLHFSDLQTADDALLRLMQLVADQSALAIENYQYFRRQERRGSELDFLIKVLTAASVARPIEDSLHDVARVIRASLDAVAIGIYLPRTEVGDGGEQRRLLRPTAFDGAEKTRWEIEPILVGDPNSLAGMVAQDLYPEVIDEIERQTDYVPLNAQASSVIFIPLAKADALDGLITVEFPPDGNPFDQDMLKLLLVLANTLPAVFQNMTLWNQLSKSEKRFRQLAESVSEVFALIDPHLHRVLYISPAFETIWGRPESYLYVDQSLDPFLETIHPDDRDQFMEQRNRAAGGVHPEAATEMRIIRPDGEIRWIRIHTFPVENEAGQVYRLATVSEDITQRKVADEQALELVVERHKTHLLGEFITNMSHDFRTPLATINTSTYLLERTDDPHTRSKRIQVIGQQVIRLEKLLDGLLTITRLDQGVELKLAPVDLSELALQIESRVQVLIAPRRQTIRLETDSRAVAVADAIRLDQALMNLIQNAIQFTPEGGEIVLATGVIGSRVYLEVRDSGIGIEAADLPHVFDRFYRADRARGPETGGIGLGLAIARKIVELHDGTIEVESVLNRGTTFRMMLPRA